MSQDFDPLKNTEEVYEIDGYKVNKMFVFHIACKTYCRWDANTLNNHQRFWYRCPKCLENIPDTVQQFFTLYFNSTIYFGKKPE